MPARSSVSVFILLAIMAIGCGRGGSKSTGGAPGDSDGDGLADVDETSVYHTSPDTKDTDGDGYDDYQEVRELGFDRSNPTKFNPLVADVPRIMIEVITAPEVTITYSKSAGKIDTSEVGRTDTTGKTQMASRGGEINVSSTVSATVGVSGFKPEASVTASLTMGTSVNWSTQESYESQRALSEMRSHSQSSDLHTDGGQIRVAAAITNTGHIPFTIQNLALAASRKVKAQTRPITQLEADSARPFFEMGTWIPGERTESIFVARNLPLSDIEEILTGNLTIQVGKYELKDANGQSFGHRVGAINAACAQVVIDYGKDAPAESYMVSTRSAPDDRGLPLSSILDALGVRSQTGKAAWTYRKLRDGQLVTDDAAMETRKTQNGLLSLNDVGTDPRQGGHWVIVHATPSGSSGFVTRTYDLLEEGYGLEDVRLKPRQAVQLAYVSDPDRDGIPTSAELDLGTDPLKADTDGDRIADGDEIAAGTDPLRNNALPQPRIGSATLEKAGQGVNLAINLPGDRNTLQRLRIEWGDASLAEEVEISASQRTVRSSHRYSSIGKYTVVVTPYAGPRSAGEPYSIPVSTVPALLAGRVIQFGTSGRDQIHQIAVDREGNAYIAGQAGSITQPIKGKGQEIGRVFLAKCGRGGDPLWVVQFGLENETPVGLAIDREGNVHQAIQLKPDPNLRHLNIHSLRTYTPSGKFLRERQIRGYGSMRDLDLGAGGNAEMVYFAFDNPNDPGDIRLGVFPGVVHSGSGVSKLPPPDGNQYKQILGGSVQAIALDPSGGLYACGFLSSGAKNCFIARYEPNGELSWMQPHGDPNDHPVSIAVDGRGNAYVVEIAAGKTLTGEYDARLVKCGPDGKILWARQFGTQLFDAPLSVAVWPPVLPRGQTLDAEAIYVSGITQGDLLDETKDLDSDSKLNAFLVGYDRNGTRRFLEQFPVGAALPVAYVHPDRMTDQSRRKLFSRLPVAAYIATDEKGNVYLAGSSEQSLDFDYQSKGSADLFFVRFTPNPEEKK